MDIKIVLFNREYVPIGWNDVQHKQDLTSSESFSDIPIKTRYKNATEALLRKLIDNEANVVYGSDGKINRIYFYDDGTNPINFAKYWNPIWKRLKY